MIKRVIILIDLFRQSINYKNNIYLRIYYVYMTGSGSSPLKSLLSVVYTDAIEWTEE